MTKLTVKRRGITFVEVMVTVVILASGLTGIFRAYLTSLDYLNYLNMRLYMNFLLDQRLTDMQRQFGISGSVAGVVNNGIETIEINRENKLVEFSSRMAKVDKLENLTHITLGVTWSTNGRKSKLVRDAYLRK